jgi:hypothetical protein
LVIAKRMSVSRIAPNVMPAQDTSPLRGGEPVVAGIHVFPSSLRR